jgi:hypothetical protein
VELQKITPAEVRAEAAEWAKYLDEIVGILCFSFGIASASTVNPAFYSFMSFIMIALIHVVNAKKAKLLHTLQRERNRSEHSKAMLEDYFSHLPWPIKLPGIFGYLFLSLIFAVAVVADKCSGFYQFLFAAQC